jgi:hypothetical protein
MKLALGIIARPVESLLVLCLRPVISHFDGLILLTLPYPTWRDGVVGFFLHDEKRRIHIRDNYKWINDYAHARNTLIKDAEALGYDWLMMLDADESMLPDDLVSMCNYMENGYESLIFPRYEFVDDFHHFCPSFYPDYQARAFKLNMGYHYTGKLHEDLHKGQDPPARKMPYSTLLPMCHIFHYGKSKPTEEVWKKYDTYERIAAGKDPRDRPPEVPLPNSWSCGNKKILFLGNKPL